MPPSDAHIENRTYDEIEVGDTATLERRLTMEDVKLFAVMSGDVNPAHVDEDFAKSSRFQEIIAHGMWGGALISTLLGTELPGPGTIYLGQTLQFKKPVVLGDILTVTVEATEKDDEKKRIRFHCLCRNQEGKTVIEGDADVLAPTDKVKRARTVMPQVRMAERAHLHELLEAASSPEPLPTAVVHPVDANSLRGALQAASKELIIPVLVGPEDRIQQAAREAELDISDLRLVSTKHSHEAAERAVALARKGEVGALMKGSLHTDELLRATMHKEKGLRTERRMSHVMAFDVPTYPRPLFITDAAINIYPTLEHKADIVRNAIELAHAIEIKEPRVAILSAVETVNPKLSSTLEAAALCKMAERRQIKGGILDGPLAFDNAISESAARTKGIDSRVAGRADILVAPDLEAANMLMKQLTHLADATGAGVVVGARVPIMLTSRADDALTRMASCALALLLAEYQTRQN
ncbi:bifunctional enoyl-CoA hydratase/phosphate acetyltransferase [Thioalkalivibrio sp.]|uniref:bifunctional enoyl-CoA hydratase/phosphate acetyltransferase n=1 Tax=Thioalkalivibrio sp. TaxID=2093813 RepID=UPI0035641117